MPKRILLLTFFYPPDLSAGSFRARALVEALRGHADGAVQIDVLTTQPNRYHEHASETLVFESGDGVRVRRIRLPAHRSGFRDQALAFVTFAYQAMRHASDERYDLVVATSSRLMTAVLGAWIAYRQSARLYLDIRDIFVENLGELFSAPVSKILMMGFGALERWVVRRADKVNLVTAGFLGYFQPKFPERRFSQYPNGVDDDFVGFPLCGCGNAGAERPLQILYAGNVGDGQGLHRIVPELARRLGGEVHFRIVGGGSRLQVLREAIASGGLGNVELVEPVAREELLGLYHQADVLFLHLNDFRAFRRVLPSKVFEYAATGKPIWAGAAGYAAEFIHTEISNAAVFAPCDSAGAIEALRRLKREQTPRPDFVARYARSRIMRLMAADVLELVEDAN
ncbi:glycosyltransferase family 4 protein [Stutzerimonas nitrititolerans]|uniref:glycosyltransferase family 4 protein n=1 Tax=Stutzerimonas nitrititolerans TaxID=2482751 RepID=UPI0028B142A9|nr:glycosyltransferase family 4 protein [Stutzerimonas nitrititolerans]